MTKQLIELPRALAAVREL